jgi:DNA-binding CsgD family transcriptional regulator
LRQQQVGQRDRPVGARRGGLVEELEERRGKTVGDALAVAGDEGAVVDESAAGLWAQLGDTGDHAATEAVADEDRGSVERVERVDHGPDVIIVADVQAVIVGAGSRVGRHCLSGGDAVSCDPVPDRRTGARSAGTGCDLAIDRTFRAGAAAYILKSAATADVISVLRQVFSGAVFHAPANPPLCCATPEHPEHPGLSDRERTVLGAVAAGLTTAAIGRQLWISDHTVKFHLTNIYRKLGVRNRAGAVRYAIEHDLAQA